MLSKNWIQQNLFTKTGNLNNRVCLDSWWINRNYTSLLNELKSSTSFLPKLSTITERLYCIYHSLNKKPLCYCGNETNFINFKSGYYDYCSKFCATQCPKRNAKIVASADYEKMKESYKKTCLEKYGVEHWYQSKEAIEKIKQTKLEKYGNEKFNNTKKAKETCLQKYGYEYTSQVPEIILKIQETKSKINPNLRDKNWLIEQNKTKSVTQIAEELNVTYRTVYLWFLKHEIEMNFFSSNFGKEQKEIEDFIVSLGIQNVVMNDRNKIKPKELDIYLPDYSLAIEFNGMYWHAEDKTRHLNKLNLCNEKNIKLLQIWDIEWQLKEDIVKSIIKSNLNLNEKIYARNCEIKEIDSKSYKQFLEDNHIQGNVNSSIRVGLFYQQKLISVIGFGKSRFDKKYEYELLRFCNALNTNVIGGFSKLMKYAINNYNMNSIQTFCDLRFFNGKVYENFGFRFSHQTKPGYVYYNKGIVKNRQEFQKHKLKSALKEFDETLSERENCKNNGWLQVWDCGQKVYYWKK